MPERHDDTERAIAAAREVARGNTRELTSADLQLVLDALDLARAQARDARAYLANDVQPPAGFFDFTANAISIAPAGRPVETYHLSTCMCADCYASRPPVADTPGEVHDA